MLQACSCIVELSSLHAMFEHFLECVNNAGNSFSRRQAFAGLLLSAIPHTHSSLPAQLMESVLRDVGALITDRGISLMERASGSETFAVRLSNGMYVCVRVCVCVLFVYILFLKDYEQESKDDFRLLFEAVSEVRNCACACCCDLSR